ncbi:hypothetical protein B0H66DRAFT_573089 [Apodospora peruviana]|uniref:Radical SAM core domain-containing protein n=1 Tax=Apodospora peruviana TaxID=516989 RepID=A0AAE0MGJ1_9PEZI|nr:hypothetical protein B0H66DRAFT_573089 [Apodospora peruviana]
MAATIIYTTLLFIRTILPLLKDRPSIPVSVNYFFTRKCNKTCGFCFHTAKTSYLNIAGGEPFLYPKFLGAMVRFCKEDLRLPSVSIVTNGSKVTQRFLAEHAKYIDVLAVSCDSFNEQTNIAIGRGDGDNVSQLFRIRDWCMEYNIKFKLNTVVNRLNQAEDMNAMVKQLQPFRWKVFQVLVVGGENESEDRLRDARGMTITDEEFEAFCERHKGIKAMIPESNRVMASSYLLVDEYMRFMDKGSNEKMKESDSILDVGVEKAMVKVRWDEDAFYERGGVYNWSKTIPGKEKKPACGSGLAAGGALDW